MRTSRQGADDKPMASGVVHHASCSSEPFPVPLPDESLHSLMGRFRAQSGILYTKDFRHRVGLSSRGHLAKAAGHFLLLPLLRLAGSRVWADVDEVIRDHSMLPLFTPFLAPARVEGLKERLLDPALAAGDGKAVLGPSVSFVMLGLGGQPLRLCPVCFQDDQRRFGWPYWHRSHQARNVRCCWRHECRLVERCHVCTRLLGEYENPLPPRSTCQCGNRDVLGHPIAADCAQDVSLARMVHDVLRADLPPIDVGVRAQVYQAAWALRVSCAAEKRVAATEAALDRHFGARWLASLEVGRNGTLPQDWFAKLASKRVHREAVIDPILHLLGIQFLFGGLDGFVKAVEQAPAIVHASGRSQLDVPDELLWTESDQRTEDAFIQEVSRRLEAGDTVEEIGARFRVARGDILVLRYRIQSGSDGFTVVGPDGFIEQALIDFRSGASCEDLIKKTGKHRWIFSAILWVYPRVRRVRDREEFRTERAARRASLLSLMRTRRLKRRPDVQAIDGALVRWLSVHDREWLNAKLPPRAPGAPGHPTVRKRTAVKDGLDAEAMVRMLESARVEAEERLASRRMSKKLLAAVIGRSVQWLIYRCNKHPEARALLDSIAESPIQYARRRMARGLDELDRQGIALSLSSFCEHFGLKFETAAAALKEDPKLARRFGRGA